MVSWPVRDSNVSERLHVNPRRISGNPAGTDGGSTQVERASCVLRLRDRMWSFRRSPAQVVAPSLVGGLIAALVVLLTLTPTRAADFSDVTLRTGSQLKDRLLDTLEKDQNMKAAVAFFADDKLKVDTNGLVEITFRVDKAPDLDKMLFVPFDDKSDGPKHVVVLAQSPKNSRVMLATLSGDPKLPEVKDEKVAIDGKIQPGQGQLKSFFKCAFVSCVGAGAGCLYGGPAWLPCFCLWCGGSAVGCAIIELLLP